MTLTTQKPKLQSIILLGPGTELFPLASKTHPKFNIPLLNIPLLVYNIRWLEKDSSEIFIVGLRSHEHLVKEILYGYSFMCRIEYIPIAGYEGSVVSLLKIKDRITGDVVLTKGDIIGTMELNTILHEFYTCTACDTQCLKHSNNVFLALFSRKKSDCAVSAYTNNTLLFFSTALDDLSVLRARTLKPYGRVTFCTDLEPSQVYVFKKEVFDIFNPSYFSFKSSMLPFIVDFYRERGGVKIFVGDVKQIKSLNEYVEGCYFLKEEWCKKHMHEQIQGVLEDEPVTLFPQPVHLKEHINPRLPRIKKASFKDKETSTKSLTASNASAEKAILINTIVGEECVIGGNTLISDSVLLKGVVVGEECRIEGCVIGNGVVIPKGSVIVKCRVASGYVFSPGVRATSQVFSIIDF